MVTTQFSDTQWNQIMEAWRIFDTDGDGLVTVQDLRTLMLSFGYDHSEKELAAYLDDLPICVEGDRALDMPEFVLWTVKLGERIEAEDREEALSKEKALRDNIPPAASQRSTVMREALATMTENREALEALMDQQREVLDRELFDAVDSDGNGYLAYQDLEKLSRQLGEPWEFKDLDEMMYAVTELGQARRLSFPAFREMLRRPLAWDEPDKYPCQEKLLAAQEEARQRDRDLIRAAERRGKSKSKPARRCAVS
mmetsp:Transcript_19213/g.40400  ORF Transcript_19213/g.40400 Transcript_19213/m.40400 type:complete len:254 (-) Transcript_19213:129-890(-)